MQKYIGVTILVVVVFGVLIGSYFMLIDKNKDNINLENNLNIIQNNTTIELQEENEMLRNKLCIEAQKVKMLNDIADLDNEILNRYAPDLYPIKLINARNLELEAECAKYGLYIK